MTTTYLTCPACGEETMWVRWQVLHRVEPARIDAREWACEGGCEVDEDEVIEAIRAWTVVEV